MFSELHFTSHRIQWLDGSYCTHDFEIHTNKAWLFIKFRIYPKQRICWLFTHPQTIQHIGGLFSLILGGSQNTSERLPELWQSKKQIHAEQNEYSWLMTIDLRSYEAKPLVCARNCLLKSSQNLDSESSHPDRDRIQSGPISISYFKRTNYK